MGVKEGSLIILGLIWILLEDNISLCNVRSVKKHTKRSNIPLLRLVYFFTERTLLMLGASVYISGTVVQFLYILIGQAITDWPIETYSNHTITLVP